MLLDLFILALVATNLGLTIALSKKDDPDTVSSVKHLPNAILKRHGRLIYPKTDAQMLRTEIIEQNKQKGIDTNLSDL